MNRTDSEIEGYVKEELQWSPDLDSGDVAVSVKQGVVTLTGFVRSYLDKYEAEAAAKRVAGVTAVANDIEVRLPSVDQRPDCVPREPVRQIGRRCSTEAPRFLALRLILDLPSSA
jgi:hypothetical protein